MRGRKRFFSRTDGRKEALAEAPGAERAEGGRGKRQDETVEEMSKKEMAEADTRS